MPFAPFDRHADDLAGERGLDHFVDLAHAHAERGRPGSIDANLDIGLASNGIGDHVDRAAQSASPRGPPLPSRG